MTTEHQPPPPKHQLEPVELPAGARYLAIGLVLVVVLGILALTAGPSLYRHFRDNAVREHGTDAIATIVALKHTGDRYNEEPIIQLTLEVAPEGREPYRVTIEAVLSALVLSESEVGGQVRVRFDPDDPSVVVLIGPYEPR